MAKPLSFKDFLTVDYTPGMPEEISYAAMKRKRGRIGEDVNEVLSAQGRRALARAMKRYKSKIKQGRKRALNRAADSDRINKRSRKQAVNQIFKTLSKGKARGELSVSRRKEIEKRVQKLKPRVDRIARRLKPKVRQMDRERRSG